MKVITAPEEYIKEDGDICVFLAGGITNCPEWQKDIIKELEKHDRCKDSDKTLVLFNPRRDDFSNMTEKDIDEQIEWEFNMLEKMDIFSMYFCKDQLQPICLYELGRYIPRMQQRFPEDWASRIAISIEEGYPRRKDVEVQAKLAFCFDDIVLFKHKFINDVLNQTTLSSHALKIHECVMHRIKFS